MLRFSQRKGLKEIKTSIQVNDMDEDLRNGLWSVLTLFLWNKMRNLTWVRENNYIHMIFVELWLGYIKEPLDTMPQNWIELYKQIREYYFQAQWYEVYDFIEFIASNSTDENIRSVILIAFNDVLEKELSAYRFVEGHILETTSNVEIEGIESALEKTSPLKPVNTHLSTSLSLLSDRKNPDYRNSIKESISAVESICKLITNDNNATLGQALKTIQKQGTVKIHNALSDSLKKLYGYTSDSDGIRHALLEESNLHFEDAKYMLVSCSSFINYLIEKSRKADIDLKKK